ncbi:MAG: hypothetical protein KY396_08390 [Actinobacteria bacterium]|nr:hypothetical protein [Actinomycetota bacterium]
MRQRLVISFCAFALLLPATALAAKAARGDGTLSIKNANVTKVVIKANGAVLGRFDSGKLFLTDHVATDAAEPVFIGCEKIDPISEKTTVCSGKNIRFRSIGGRFTVRIVNASDLDLSAVGRGSVTLEGKGTFNDGKYSFDGEAEKALPSVERLFWLGDPPPTPVIPNP